MKASTLAQAPLILVIEDHSETAEAIQHWLDAEGYRSVWARDGAQGLELARMLCPQVIVLDLLMPVLDGMEFLQLYFQQRSSVSAAAPIVAMTSLESYRQQALDLGADCCILKPLCFEDLLAAVTDALLPRAEVLDKPQQETGSWIAPSHYWVPAVRALESSAHFQRCSPLEWLVQFLEVEACLYQVAGAETLHCRTAAGPEAEAWMLDSEPAWKSLARFTGDAGETLIVADLLRNPLFRFSSWRADRGIRFYAGTPVFGEQGEVRGVLSLISRKPREMGHAESRMLALFAEALETDLLQGAEAFQRTHFRELLDLIISSSQLTRKSWVLAHATSDDWTVLSRKVADPCLAIRLSSTRFALVIDAAARTSVEAILPHVQNAVHLQRFSGFTLQALQQLLTDTGNAA